MGTPRFLPMTSGPSSHRHSSVKLVQNSESLHTQGVTVMEGIGWCSFVVVTSLFAVLYTKFQVTTPDGFPYPVPLLLIQSFIASCVGWSAFVFFPMSFPSMKRVLSQKGNVMKQVGPLATVMAIGFTFQLRSLSEVQDSTRFVLTALNVLVVYGLVCGLRLNEFRTRHALMLSAMVMFALGSVPSGGIFLPTYNATILAVGTTGLVAARMVMIHSTVRYIDPLTLMTISCSLMCCIMAIGTAATFDVAWFSRTGVGSQIGMSSLCFFLFNLASFHVIHRLSSQATAIADMTKEVLLVPAATALPVVQFTSFVMFCFATWLYGMMNQDEFRVHFAFSFTEGLASVFRWLIYGSERGPPIPSMRFTSEINNYSSPKANFTPGNLGHKGPEKRRQFNMKSYGSNDVIDKTEEDTLFKPVPMGSDPGSDWDLEVGNASNVFDPYGPPANVEMSDTSSSNYEMKGNPQDPYEMRANMYSNMDTLISGERKPHYSKPASEPSDNRSTFSNPSASNFGSNPSTFSNNQSNQIIGSTRQINQFNNLVNDVFGGQDSGPETPIRNRTPESSVRSVPPF